VSLINDALRKARQAAAEHESRQPEAAFRTPKAYPSHGPRRRRGAALVVLVAVAAGLTGAALVWWTLGKGEPAAAVTGLLPADAVSGREEGPRSASVTEPIKGPSTEPGGAVEPRETPASEAESPPDPPTRGPATESAAVSHDQSTHLDSAPPIAPSPAPDGPLVQEDPADGERVFVLDADLGYASLSLGFIVARKLYPFAEINGTEVFEGSEVAGFVVERIEPNRVILRDDRGKLILRVP